MICDDCGESLFESEFGDWLHHGPRGCIKLAVEKAVREEREAVVHYLRHVSSDESWIDAQTAIPWIERGEHRK